MDEGKLSPLSEAILLGGSFRVVMGQRPTHRNESQDVTPAKAGVHARE
jgi:hypothetical protein